MKRRVSSLLIFLLFALVVPLACAFRALAIMVLVLGTDLRFILRMCVPYLLRVLFPGSGYYRKEGSNKKPGWFWKRPGKKYKRDDSFIAYEWFSPSWAKKIFHEKP